MTDPVLDYTTAESRFSMEMSWFGADPRDYIIMAYYP